MTKIKTAEPKAMSDSETTTEKKVFKILRVSVAV